MVGGESWRADDPGIRNPGVLCLKAHPSEWRREELGVLVGVVDERNRHGLVCFSVLDLIEPTRQDLAPPRRVFEPKPENSGSGSKRVARRDALGHVR